MRPEVNISLTDQWSSGQSVYISNDRLGFDSRTGQTQNYKNWYSQFPCLTFSNYRDGVKPQPCVVALVDRWQLDLEDRKVPSLPAGQGILVNKM